MKPRPSATLTFTTLLAMSATPALASPQPTCSGAAQVGTEPAPQALAGFLRGAEDALTQNTLQETFCEEPQNFCEAVRDFSPEAQLIPFTGPNFHSLRHLLSDEGRVHVSEELRQRTGPDRPLLQPLYEGASLERLQNLYQSAQGALIEHLSQGHLSTPRVAIEKIQGLKLLNPFDGSVPLETRNELMASCGLGPEWSTPTGQSLGEFNAFANVDGYVVVCPQMLFAQNDEGLMTVLIHEIAHQLGPCLVGGALLAQLTEPECTLDSRNQPEVSPWLDWLGRTKKLEQCFHRAGINEGTDMQWISRVFKREIRKQGLGSESSEATSTACSSRIAHHLMPSDRIQEGLLSSCDPSQFYMLVQVFSMMEQAELKANGNKSLRNRARALQLQARTLQSLARSMVPNTNQFNEAMSDVFAAQLLGRALERYHSIPNARPNELKKPRPNDVLAGLSTLCAEKKSWRMRGEAHSRDDRRMEIFASQSEIRELVGCSKQAPRGLSERLAQCQGLGL
jgi:hypothetical protein